MRVGVGSIYRGIFRDGLGKDPLEKENLNNPFLGVIIVEILIRVFPFGLIQKVL